MSDMIERVARAIEKTYEDFADPTPAQRARAAIEAMRDLSEPMRLAGIEAGYAQTDGIMAASDLEIKVTPIWYAMIDAALVVSGDRTPEASCYVVD